jgi:hypothetical protein
MCLRNFLEYLPKLKQYSTLFVLWLLFFLGIYLNLEKVMGDVLNLVFLYRPCRNAPAC